MRQVNSILFRSDVNQMNPDTVLQSMYNNARAMEAKANEYAELGIALADAEKNYRVALSTKMLKLKSDGIAISTCETLAKGDSLVAELRFERDKCEIILDACKKAMTVLDKKIEILRSDLSWQKADIHYTPGQTQ